MVHASRNPNSRFPSLAAPTFDSRTIAVVAVAIQLLVSLSLVYGDFPKIQALAASIDLFTRMSQAGHGIVSEPVFRLGAAFFEIAGAVLFLLPRTARLGAAWISLYMCGVVLSHIFVLGFGLAFDDALVTFLLPLVYLYLSRKPSRAVSRVAAPA